MFFIAFTHWRNIPDRRDLVVFTTTCRCRQHVVHKTLYLCDMAFILVSEYDFDSKEWTNACTGRARQALGSDDLLGMQ